MTPRERADRAKQLLDDPLFRAVLRDMRDRIVAECETTSFGDIDSHHQTAITLKLLADIPALLKRYAEELTIEKNAQAANTWLQRAKQTLENYGY